MTLQEFERTFSLKDRIDGPIYQYSVDSYDISVNSSIITVSHSLAAFYGIDEMKAFSIKDRI